MIFQPTHGTLLLWWTAYTLRRFWDFVLFSFNMVWRLLRQLFLGLIWLGDCCVMSQPTHFLACGFWLFWSPLSNAVLVFLWCRCGGRSPRLLFTPLELGATTMTRLESSRSKKLTPSYFLSIHCIVFRSERVHTLHLTVSNVVNNNNNNDNDHNHNANNKND